MQPDPQNPESDGPEQGPRLSRSERREKAASDALRTFVRDLHLSRFGVVSSGPDEVDLVLHLKAKPNADWELRFEPALGEQIHAQIEDVQAGRDAFRKGHIHCFRCDSVECEHSVPVTPLSVFKGYAANGVPEWDELAQVLIDAKDSRVDQLFESRPAVVSLLQLGRDLKAQQLSSFGRSSKTYSILGQVVAGYFSSPANHESIRPSRVAITFQAVEARGAHGDVRVHLNAVACLPSGGSLADALGSGWQPAIHRAREEAARALEGIEMRVNAARARHETERAWEALRGVPRVLQRLAESLERGGRQETRRTRHVEQRRHERRPVHKALEDATGAPAEAFFFDEKAGTFIVAGPQGRAHAFNPEGRHVTSFTLNPSSIEFRVRTHRWRQLDAGEAIEFKGKVGQSQVSEELRLQRPASTPPSTEDPNLA